jgi:integrase
MRHRVLLVTMWKAGLRPGEACALQKEEVDFATLQLHIEHAVDPVTGALKDTKTHERRTVDMTPELATILRDWIETLELEALTQPQKPGEPAPEPFLSSSRLAR